MNTVDEARKVIEEAVAKNVSEAARDIEKILEDRGLELIAVPVSDIGPDGFLRISAAMRLIPKPQ